MAVEGLWLQKLTGVQGCGRTAPVLREQEGITPAVTLKAGDDMRGALSAAREAGYPMAGEPAGIGGRIY